MMKLPKPYLTGVTGAFIALQVLFLANMCYLYGTAFHDSQRYSAFNLLYVDYDQDTIGQSVSIAYGEMKSTGFPTIIQHSPAEFPTPSDVRRAVCKGTYWGAIYSNSNASSRLENALHNPQEADPYNSSAALTYIYNGARYPAYSQIISSSLSALVQTSKSVYDQLNGTSAMATVNVTHKAIANTLLDPISASSIDLKPTEQGVRFYYNTVSMVMPILQQFFFIMALNSISTQFNLSSRLSRTNQLIWRFTLSILFSLIAALVMSGYIWAFMEGWQTAHAYQFALQWMIIWLVMHTHFLIIDAVTAFLAPAFLPFFMLTWIILNVASTISPFELSPGFYRWGYALPAYELYQVLLDIWTDGCNPILYRALPVLFSWWVVGLVVFVLGTWKRGSSPSPSEEGDSVKELSSTF